MRAERRRHRGFTLFEVITVVTIVGLLAAIAMNEFSGSVVRAKRSEAYAGLAAVDAAQQYYFAQHGVFAEDFAALDFSVQGGMQLSATTYRGNAYTYELSQPFGTDTYYCSATATSLDSDPWPDVLEIYDL